MDCWARGGDSWLSSAETRSQPGAWGRIESGERRLEVVEFVAVAKAMNVDPVNREHTGWVQLVKMQVGTSESTRQQLIRCMVMGCLAA